MKICLCGCKDGERIEIELVEVLGFPDTTSYEGGYDVACKLAIDVGCYHVCSDKLFSVTGALYKFGEQLKLCYEQLDGEAEYSLTYEKDFSFKVTMTQSGHGVVTGIFQERPDVDNKLEFEMETDQSCFLPVIQEIESLKNLYGGMRGFR